MSDLLKTEYTDYCMKKYGFRDWDSVLAALGHGGLKEGQIVNRLQNAYDKKNPKHTTDQEILDAVAKSTENAGYPVRQQRSNQKVVLWLPACLMYRFSFSKCCSPVPGDEIIGFVTRGRGVSIHRTDCVNMMNLSEADRQRIIEAEWSVDSQGSADEDYDAEIVIYAYDRMGILMDITKILTENKIDVKAMNTRTSKQGIATINVSFAIRGVEALNELIKKLRNVPSVTDIQRSRS